MGTQKVIHHPKYPVNMHYVNHGKVFTDENWYTFYCGWCQGNVFGSAKICEHCGAILQDKVAYKEK
jgi:hypothetical protein